jgi:hypothetical protein
VIDVFGERQFGQACGGSAWATWGFGGTLGWCTNPYTYDYTYTAMKASGTQSFNVNVLAAPVDSTVPEPGSMALVGAALMAAGLARARRSRS